MQMKGDNLVYQIINFYNGYSSFTDKMIETCDKPPPPPPRAGPVLTPRAPYEQPWKRSTRRCYMPNIKALGLLVSEKKNFEVFILSSYAQTYDKMINYVSTCDNTPTRAGPVLTPRTSFEQTWYRSTRRCYIPNIKALYLLLLEKKIFKDFPIFFLFVAMATRVIYGFQFFQQLW